jgi:hypothetical protein
VKFIVPALNPLGHGFYEQFVGPGGYADLLDGGRLLRLLPSRLGYATDMLAPFAAVCVFGPCGLMIALPEAVLHLVGENPGTRMLTAHYHMTILVGIVVGSILGARWLHRRLVRRMVPRRAFTTAGLIALLVTSMCYLHTQRAGPARYWVVPLEYSPAEAAQIRALLAAVPDGASVLTNDGCLSSHLARRERLIFHFKPYHADAGVMRGCRQVDYIALTIGKTTGLPDARAAAGRYGLELIGTVADVWLWRVIRPPAKPHDEDP